VSCLTSEMTENIYCAHSKVHHLVHATQTKRQVNNIGSPKNLLDALLQFEGNILP
jgi:hypothetical protein